MIVEISESAVSRLKQLCIENNKQNIKLSVNSKGCNGHSYQMDFTNDIHNLDEQIKLDGLNFVIDYKSVMFVIGMKLVWIDNGFESRFQFINPNAKSVCGCGESFGS